MVERRRMLGEILLDMGLINERQLEQALNDQKTSEEALGRILIRMGHIDGDGLGHALSEQLGVPYYKLSEMKIAQDVLSRVPGPVARQHRVVPVSVDNGHLVVAMENPMDLLVLDNLQVQLESEIRPALASDEEIGVALERYYGVEEKTIDSMMQEISQQDISFVGADESGETVIVSGAEDEQADAPVVKLVSSVIAEAFRERASDIHFEPMEDRFRVRYRIDGVCHIVQELPKRLQPPTLSRIKIMSGMDIAERRVPQDGRIQLNMSGHPIDLRVSALPGLYGESMVLRILDRGDVMRGLSDLGFFEDDMELFNDIIRMATGIFLVTGPTGSGKSTTLYAALSQLNKPDVKIITVEDPVEYQIPGINQVQVLEDIGMSFGRALRSMLRQAPDIIMVGEIRDQETAEIAIQAALTGHLVFSTLHTNDAPSAITRLIDMGVKPFLVASAVQAVMAQRLVRRNCTNCSVGRDPRADERIEIEKVIGRKFDGQVMEGPGCAQCNHTGYKGRLGIFEVMRMADEVRDLVMQRKAASSIRDMAKQLGMRTLREDAWRKVSEGATTPAEVARVTAEEEEVILKAAFDRRSED